MDIITYKKRYIKRVKISQTISLGINTIYALYNLILGISTRSNWFIIMFLYYIILALARSFAIGNETFGLNKSDIYIMRNNGILMFCLSFVLMIADVIYYSTDRGNIFRPIILIPFVIWTIAKLFISLYNVNKVKEVGSTFILVLRNISLSEAIASFMAVERAVIKTLETQRTGFTLFLDIMFGSITTIFIIMIGLNMFSKANDLLIEKKGRNNEKEFKF